MRARIHGRRRHHRRRRCRHRRHRRCCCYRRYRFLLNQRTDALFGSCKGLPRERAEDL